MRRARTWMNGEVVKTWPEIRLINSLPFNGPWEDRILFLEKRIKYLGFGLVDGETPIILRIMIVRKNAGGNPVWYLPTPEEIFGTRDISVVTNVTREWTKISDRHFFVDPRDVQPMELAHMHRLTHSMSLQESTLGANKTVTASPIYIVFYSDLCTPQQRIILQNFETLVIGEVTFVPDARDDDPQI